MAEYQNEDLGQTVIRRITKGYRVLSADADEMKVIVWVAFDQNDDEKLAQLNKMIADADRSLKKGPYKYVFGFGNPEYGGEIHSLKGMEEEDSFVLSAWYDYTNQSYDMEELTQYANDIYAKFTYYLQQLHLDESVKVYKMTLSEAKQELRDHGYSLLKETRRMGMNRQVFKPTGGDFEDFMNDNKIKSLYTYAVKAKKKNDKELIADGNDPDEYDSVWYNIDESYYIKLGAAVNKFFGEGKISIFTTPSLSIIVETDNDSFEFDLSAGEWDNVELGTERQDPLEFFKTIFKIATEK